MLACATAGAVVALASLGVHRSWVPAGLLLALATTYAVAWWLREHDRRLVVAFAAGWLVVLGLATLGRAEGDYVLAADLPGVGLLAGGAGLLVIGVVSLPGRRRPGA